MKNFSGTLSVEKIENLQGGDCGWVSIYEYILSCDGEQVAIEKLIYEGGDIEAPTLEVPADVTVECDAIPEIGTPTATDNCDQDVEITLVSDERVGDDDCSYTIVRTWTATDNCGLTDTKTQTITVLENVNLSKPDKLFSRYSFLNLLIPSERSSIGLKIFNTNERNKLLLSFINSEDKQISETIVLLA